MIAGAALTLALLPAGAGRAGTEAPAPLPAEAAADAVLRIERAPAPPAGRERAMAAWHAGYRRDAAALKGAWAALLDALRPVRGEQRVTPRTRVVAAGAAEGSRELDRRAIGAACAALGREVLGMAESGLPAPPDPAVDWHLRRALTSLEAAAAVCDADRYFLLGHRLERAGRAFLDFSRALRRYDLTP